MGMSYAYAVAQKKRSNGYQVRVGDSRVCTRPSLREPKGRPLRCRALLPLARAWYKPQYHSLAPPVQTAVPLTCTPVQIAVPLTCTPRTNRSTTHLYSPYKPQDSQ
eukprot:473580-Rhodomonas_salina.1